MNTVTWRPTGDALAMSLFLVAAGSAAWWSGDNLLYLVCCSLIAMGVMSLLPAPGMAVITARRLLPDEVVARRAARGAVELRCPLRTGPLAVRDLASVAEVSVGGLDAEQVSMAVVDWRFERRGLVRLGGLEVRTTAPFGMVERSVSFAAEDEVLVWPDAAPGGVCVDGSDPVGASRLQEAVADEIHDLRPYRPGDALRDVHGPTSARVGAPMVVVRRPVGRDEAWIVVPPGAGEAFEDEIRKAAGVLTDAWLAGRPVGLRVGATVLPPRTGPGWRRRLLEALALARPDKASR